MVSRCLCKAREFKKLVKEWSPINNNQLMLRERLFFYYCKNLFLSYNVQLILETKILSDRGKNKEKKEDLTSLVRILSTGNFHLNNFSHFLSFVINISKYFNTTFLTINFIFRNLQCIHAIVQAHTYTCKYTVYTHTPLQASISIILKHEIPIARQRTKCKTEVRIGIASQSRL